YARIYRVITHPNLESNAVMAMGDRYLYLKQASVVVGIISALHWWQLLDILWSSLQARELVFATPKSSSATRLWRLLSGLFGSLGVESSVFRFVFTVRELAEVVSQTFQAKRSSELLPRPWLNHLVVALVVTNCCMVIPIMVFLPYYYALSPETMMFPVELQFNAVWFARLMTETRFLFSLSTSDVMSRLIQHLGIYSSLTSAVVLIPGYPCSVYTYNCYLHGTTSPDEESLIHIEPDTLIFFTITHCTELKMPRCFQSFRYLFGLQLHNNTLVEWQKGSAISAATHLQLTVAALTRINLTGIPDGLLEPLPATLQVVEITHSNLSTLPPDLHTKWHALSAMYLEHTQVREFPPTLLSLPIRELSLHGNRIEKIPELADIHQSYYSFVLSGNPLVALPDTLSEGTSFTFFCAERTLLTSLPAWTRTSVSGAMYLYGTPYCESETTKESACVVHYDFADGRSPTACSFVHFSNANRLPNSRHAYLLDVAESDGVHYPADNWLETTPGNPPFKVMYDSSA
ncbi:hypothetical protein PybrP1_012207, partial [[Pythium] brassicae (nom. inval.)]